MYSVGCFACGCSPLLLDTISGIGHLFCIYASYGVADLKDLNLHLSRIAERAFCIVTQILLQLEGQIPENATFEECLIWECQKTDGLQRCENQHRARLRLLSSAFI